eukprot:5187965-Prorocentrum_lima.AAC.1
MIKIIRAGRTQKLAHLNRTHRVDCAFVIECFDTLPYMKIDTTKTIDPVSYTHLRAHETRRHH